MKIYSATLMLEAGAPIEAPQQRLGHSTPELTKRAYTSGYQHDKHTTGI